MDIWRTIVISGLFVFFPAAVGAALFPTVLTASDGGEVTFWSGLNVNTHAILDLNGFTLLNFDKGSELNRDPRIRVENGTIVMTNVQKNDKNIYKLQIFDGPGPKEALYYFKLNVTEAVHSDVTSAPPAAEPGLDKTGTHLAVIIVYSLGLIGILILSAVALWKRKWIKEKFKNMTNQNHSQQQDTAHYSAGNGQCSC